MKNIDPATATGSPELDALIAEQWMGWKTTFIAELCYVVRPEDADQRCRYSRWSPFTDPAHAVAAMLMADYATIYQTAAVTAVEVGIGDQNRVHGCGRVEPCETDGDKALALARATCRAILAAMKAKEK